jgi:hypothetical protein
MLGPVVVVYQTEDGKRIQIADVLGGRLGTWDMIVRRSKVGWTWRVFLKVMKVICRYLIFDDGSRSVSRFASAMVVIIMTRSFIHSLPSHCATLLKD